MHSQELNILCATDDAYVPYLGVMLTSLFLSNSGRKIHVFLLTDGLREENARQIQSLSERDKVITIITVDKERFSHCPVRPGDHISLATYYRLMVAELLPSEIEKILYLDCDIIVCNDLGSLWEMDLAESPLAACLDETYHIQSSRLNLPSNALYINAGVLLLNLSLWRKRNLSPLCLEYISKNSEILRLHDQDTLNCLFSQQVVPLHPRFNLQTGFLLKPFFEKVYPKDLRKQIWEAIASPVILHFTGAFKPWFSLHPSHPFGDFFWKYQRLSHFSNVHPKRISLKGYFGNLFNHMLYGFRLCRQPEPYIITHRDAEG